MLCGDNKILDDAMEAVEEVTEVINGAVGAYTALVALLTQIETVVTGFVPALIAELQAAAGGLQADLLSLLDAKNPVDFANRVKVLEKKYGGNGKVTELLKELGWDSFPPSFSLADICDKVDNIQEDGTTIPKESKNPQEPPAGEEMPKLEEIKKLNEFLDAVIEEVQSAQNQFNNDVNALKASVGVI